METQNNIKNYKKYKVINIYEKPRSYNYMAAMTNDPEEWFIELITYRKKSGDIVNINTITQKDLDIWINRYIKDGWTKV